MVIPLTYFLCGYTPHWEYWNQQLSSSQLILTDHPTQSQLKGKSTDLACLTQNNTCRDTHTDERSKHNRQPAPHSIKLHTSKTTSETVPHRSAPISQVYQILLMMRPTSFSKKNNIFVYIVSFGCMPYCSGTCNPAVVLHCFWMDEGETLFRDTQEIYLRFFYLLCY